MWKAFLICCGIGFGITLWDNLINPVGRMKFLRVLQAPKIGVILFYFIVTSAIFGLLIFVPFFLLNLIFHWVG